MTSRAIVTDSTFRTLARYGPVQVEQQQWMVVTAAGATIQRDWYAWIRGVGEQDMTAGQVRDLAGHLLAAAAHLEQLGAD
jgi:hypothetical protein